MPPKHRNKGNRNSGNPQHNKRDSRDDRRSHPTTVAKNMSHFICDGFNHGTSEEALRSFFIKEALERGETLVFGNSEMQKSSCLWTFSVLESNAAVVQRIANETTFVGMRLKLLSRESKIEKVSADDLLLQNFTELCGRCYDPTRKWLNISEIKFSDVDINWGREKTGEMLGKAIKEKCVGLTGIFMEKNNIDSLVFAKCLSRYCPTLNCLSLSGNTIESIDAFQNLKDLKIKILLITNNPVTREKDYITRIAKMLPALIELDHSLVNTPMQFDIPIDFLYQSLPPINPPLWELPTAPFEEKLFRLLTGIESKMINDTSMRDFYDENAIFTLSVPRGMKHILDSFGSVSRNLTEKPDMDANVKHFFHGIPQIWNAFGKMPTTKVDKTSCFFETFNVGEFYLVNMFGRASIEERNFVKRYSFVRIFTFDTTFHIVSDMLCITEDVGDTKSLWGGVVTVSLVNEANIVALMDKFPIQQEAAIVALKNSQTLDEASAMIERAINNGQLPQNLLRQQ